MTTYETHLSDPALLRDVAARIARRRTDTAVLLARLAELDSRRLYLPAGYPSMFEYCVRELRLSEDSAYKLIRAARTAREFPAIFAAVDAGRLHLSAVVMVTPHLTSETAEELVAAATHKSKAEIEQLLAERFPRPDVPALVSVAAGQVKRGQTKLAPGPVASSAPGRMDEPAARVQPIAPERYALQLTMDRETRDMLRYAQELLGHQVTSGDVAEVLKRALRALIAQLEKRKFAATDKPRASKRSKSANPRHIPAHVKRTVWARDGGRCTFVSESGRRCPARRLLEYDHVDPVARGGEASVAGIRLRCRAHNQHTAECEFGAEFMKHKREARREAAEARAQANGRAAATAPVQGNAAESTPTVKAPSMIQNADDLDLVPGLRRLGFRADEARRAAALVAAIPDATLEHRIRAALSFLRPGNTRGVSMPAG